METNVNNQRHEARDDRRKWYSNIYVRQKCTKEEGKKVTGRGHSMELTSKRIKEKET